MKRLILCLTFACCSLLHAASELDHAALAQLAVQEHGRKKPFTTFAREMTLSLTGRTTLPLVKGEGTSEAISADELILNLWLLPEGWDEKPLILVTHGELKKRLELPLETDQKLFSFKQLVANPGFQALLTETQNLRQQGKGEDLSPVQKEAEHLSERLQLFQDLITGDKYRIVPHPSEINGTWLHVTDLPDPRLFQQWATAYRSGDLAQFNALTPQLVAQLRGLSPTVYPSAESLAFEYHYMTFHPFLWAWITYLFALLALALTASWIRRLGYGITWALVLIGLGFELYGLYCRVVISGRPPVTNMYETVIWVSFVVMVFSIILEAIYRRRYFFIAGLLASIITLIIADTQPTILDSSINPLTAVLRNNMWLMIHVLTIVSSYGAFLLAATLGVLALILEIRGRISRQELAEVHLFIYRAMQIGVLLLAAGTILGGVWANYSWGRFWGWDPKETWALATLLCYLVLLHGRLAGFLRGFGIAFGAVACFLSVIMSWYGVNFWLGKGLHSYGFGTGGFSYVFCFALGLIAFLVYAFWSIKLRKGTLVRA